MNMQMFTTLLYTDLDNTKDFVQKLNESREMFEILDKKNISSKLENVSLMKTQEVEMCKVETLRSRFQDSIEILKSKIKIFLETQQGNVSLLIFDSIPGKTKLSWDEKPWVEKEFEEAVSLAEVRHF
jgi:hypothetical protein